jgi:hypothetical protein
MFINVVSIYLNTKTMGDEVLTRQCPCLRAFDSRSVCGRLADSTASDRNRTHTGIYPGSAPRRVMTYILLVKSCVACIVGAVTMVRRWDLAEVEEDSVASLCTWDLCEIKCLCEIRDRPFLAAPPRPYMAGEVSGSGPSRLQVYANPN